MFPTSSCGANGAAEKRLPDLSAIHVCFLFLFSPGLVGLSLSFAMSITQTLNWAVRMEAERENNIVSVERIREYSATEPEAELTVDNPPPPTWPQKGRISIKQLYMRYRSDLDFVLRGINLEIPPGTKLGIVGRTGAGKSSLFLALERLVEPSGGDVIIDGVSIRSIGLHDLRKRIAVIPQDPVLFSGSLRFNLDPFREHDDASIWNALQMAGMDSAVRQKAEQEDVSRVAELRKQERERCVCVFVLVLEFFFHVVERNKKTTVDGLLFGRRVDTRSFNTEKKRCSEKVVPRRRSSPRPAAPTNGP